jgi:hypothetical protein
MLSEIGAHNCQHTESARQTVLHCAALETLASAIYCHKAYVYECLSGGPTWVAVLRTQTGQNKPGQSFNCKQIWHFQNSDWCIGQAAM